MPIAYNSDGRHQWPLRAPPATLSPWQPLDTESPARVRQETREAARKRRRALHRLLLIALVTGALLGFVAGLLVADRWFGGREVIFIPMDGTEV